MKDDGSLVYYLVAGIVALATCVVALWRLLDGRAAKRIDDEISRANEAHKRAERYEEQRDKAMETAKEGATLLASLAAQLRDSDQRCRDGLAALSKKLDDLQGMLSREVRR